MTVRQRPFPRTTLKRARASLNLNTSADAVADFEEKGAMGFLSFVETEEQSAPSANSNFVSQYQSLQQTFPDFPARMVKALLLREDGRGRRVYNVLASQGWKPVIRNGSFASVLSMAPNEHFTVPYFWGLYRPEYKNILANAGPGAFLTGFTNLANRSLQNIGMADEIVYQVWYVNGKGRIRQCPSTSAQLPEDYKKLLSLSKSISRPQCIPPSDLVWFPVQSIDIK